MKTQVRPFNRTKSIAFQNPEYLRLIFILLLLTCFSSVALAQTKQWDKTFGGSFDDRLTSLQLAANGGYMLGGAGSDTGGDKSEDAKGSLDDWVVKLNAAGTKEWDKTLGGNNEDHLSSLQQTADGG